MATKTKTIGATSRDYATVALWAADLDDGTNAANDTTAYASTDDAVGELYDDANITDGAVTISGGGTVGLNSITLTVADGQGHTGQAGTGVEWVSQGNNEFLIISTLVEFILDGVELNGNGNAIQAAVSMTGGSGQICNIHRCIYHNVTGALGYLEGILETGGSRDHTLTNNLIYDLTQTASSTQWAVGLSTDNTTNAVVRNNTIYNITNNNGSGNCYGIYMNTDSALNYVQNNAVFTIGGTSSGTFECFETDGDTNTNQDHNAATDTTAFGTGSLDSRTVGDELEDPGGTPDDLLLKTGATCIGAGTDLGTTDTVNIDILGRDRDAQGDTWDIGAHQTFSAGSSIPVLGFNHFQRNTGSGL